MANTDYLVTIQQFGGSGTTSPAISVQAPMPDTFMYDASSTYEAPYAKGLTGSGAVTNILAAVGYRATMQVLTAQLWTGSQESQLSLKLEFATETDPLTDVRLPILNLLKLATPGTNPTTGVMTSPGPSLDLSAQNVAQVLTDTGSNLGASLSAITGGNNIVSSFLQSAGTFVGAKAGQLTNMLSASTNAQSKALTPSTTSPSDMTRGSYWKSKLKNNITIKIGNYMYFDSVVITNVQQTFASDFDYATGWPHYVEVSVQFKPLFMITKDDLENIFLNPLGQQSASSGNTGIIPGLNLPSPTGIFNSAVSGVSGLLGG